MTEPKIDRRGAWCPHCSNRDSVKKRTDLSCAFIVLIFMTLGLALLVYIFLPKSWHCQVCKHQWRA